MTNKPENVFARTAPEAMTGEAIATTNGITSSDRQGVFLAMT